MGDSKTITNLFFLGRRDEKRASTAAVSEEARLIDRIREGDENAFNELYRRLSPLVHGIVFSRVPPDEVEDIVQEVFILAFNGLHKLQNKNAVGPWIASIARNRAVEYFRRNKPTEELPESLAQRKSAQTEAQEILDAIMELPDAYKETLVLRLVEGLTGPEIADKTGLTHASVRVNLHRGMKMLRSKLEIKR